MWGCGEGGNHPQVRICRQILDFVGKFKSGFGCNRLRLLMTKIFDGKPWQSHGQTQSWGSGTQANASQLLI